MVYERILDEHGQFKEIKILSTGKIIKCRTVTDLGNNMIICIDDNMLELFDTRNKVSFRIESDTYGQIGNLASVSVEADNNETNERVSCYIVQDVDKVKVFRNGIDLSYSTDILENENIEDYTKMLIGVFDRANYINTNSLFQSAKSIITQFALEQVTKVVNYKFDNAPIVTKLIEVEKETLKSQLEELTSQLSKTYYDPEIEKISNDINRINYQILSYNNVVAQIQSNDNIKR